MERIHSRILKELVDAREPLLAKHFIKSNFWQAQQDRRESEHLRSVPGTALAEPLDVYPVVIGGANIMRCSKLSPMAKKMVGTIHKNDLDIKWVITAPIANNKDILAVKAHLARMHFIESVMADPTIHARISAIAAKLSDGKVSVKLEARDQTRVGPRMLRNALMWVIYATYIDTATNTPIATKELVDTGLYSSFSQEFFHGTRNHNRKNHKTAYTETVPVYVHKGVPFATCGWSYYDTVRMLVLYGQRYRKVASNPTAIRDRRWMYLRYIKYLAKFTVLYTQINRINESPELTTLYESVKRQLGRSAQIMKGENAKIAKRSDLTEKERRIMASLLEMLEGKTNMRQLEAAISKGEHLFTMRHSDYYGS